MAILTADAPVNVIVGWRARDHRQRPDDCPGCGRYLYNHTPIAHTQEACDCDKAEGTHLVETTWHRACLRVSR